MIRTFAAAGSQYACPDATLMCTAPGWLTCADLNDCSSNGECVKGTCFCDPSWGGDDCSVFVCVNSCSNVRRSVVATQWHSAARLVSQGQHGLAGGLCLLLRVRFAAARCASAIAVRESG